MFELLEDLKDEEFVMKHAFIDEELSSFEFPNVNSINGNIEISQRQMKMLEMTVPSLDVSIQKLVLKTADPATHVVGIIIPNKKDSSDSANKSMEFPEHIKNSADINRIISSNQRRI